MIVDQAELEEDIQEHSIFDTPKAIAAYIILGTLGYTVFLGMPIVVGILVDKIGFTDAQAGYISGMENFGMFLGSLIVSALVLKVNRRLLAGAGLAIAIAVNFACIYITDHDSFLAIRLLSGIGAGAVYAVAVAMIAGTTDTVRNFTYLIFSLALTNAVVLYAFPIISELYDSNGVFLTFCGMFTLGFLTLHWMPIHTKTYNNERIYEVESSVKIVPAKLILVCISGIFCFYFLIGMFWSYVERIGVGLGYTSQWMGSTLSIGTLLSLIACVMAYGISRKFGSSRPLITALLSLALINFAFALNFTPMFFLVSLFAVLGLWNFIDIYQMGTVADMDHSGRFAALVPGAQALPLAIAPAFTGFLLEANWQYNQIIWLWGLSAALALFAYSFVYWRLRRSEIHIVD